MECTDKSAAEVLRRYDEQALSDAASQPPDGGKRRAQTQDAPSRPGPDVHVFALHSGRSKAQEDLAVYWMRRTEPIYQGAPPGSTILQCAVKWLNLYLRARRQGCPREVFLPSGAGRHAKGLDLPVVRQHSSRPRCSHDVVSSSLRARRHCVDVARSRCGAVAGAPDAHNSSANDMRRDLDIMAEILRAHLAGGPEARDRTTAGQ